MRKTLIFTIAALITANAFAAGEVYRWKDASGNWHFSDQPQPGAELVRGARRGTPAPAAAPPPASPPAQTVATSEALPVSDGVAREVRQQAAAIKAEQCKKAEEAYQQQLRAQRIYREDQDGNRTFLSAEEIDAARLQARSARDLACNP